MMAEFVDTQGNEEQLSLYDENSEFGKEPIARKGALCDQSELENGEQQVPTETLMAFRVSTTSSLSTKTNISNCEGHYIDDSCVEFSEREPMLEKYKKSLYVLRPRFEQALLVDNFISKLHVDAGGFLSDNEEGDIESEDTKQKKVRSLLGILRTKTNRDFHTFCEVLQSSGYDHFANQLRDEAGVKRQLPKDENPAETDRRLQEKRIAFGLDSLVEAIRNCWPLLGQVFTEFRNSVKQLEPDSPIFNKVQSMCQALISSKAEVCRIESVPSEVRAFADHIIHKHTTALDIELIHEVASILNEPTLIRVVEEYEAEIKPYVQLSIDQLTDRCEEKRIDEDSPPGTYKLVLKFPDNANVKDLFKAKHFLEKYLHIPEAKFLAFDYGCFLVYFEIICTNDVFKHLPKRLADHSDRMKPMGIDGVFLISHWAWNSNSNDIYFHDDNNESLIMEVDVKHDTNFKIPEEPISCVCADYSPVLNVAEYKTLLTTVCNTVTITDLSFGEDERMTFVPKFTDSFTTDCDAQSSAMDIDESTEQEIHSISESSCSRRPSPITDDEEILPVQKTEQSAIEGIEIEMYQGHPPCFRMIPFHSPQETPAIRHPMFLFGWQRELVRYAITGQYEKLLKGILDSLQTDANICLNLGKGHTQIFPLFDVSLKSGENLLQLALEGVLMAENAGENLELLRKKFPDFPCSLYLLYRAKLASPTCNTSEYKLEEHQAFLCNGEYNRDERMTPVPRLTGSSSADCDGQSNESAAHIDESTEQEIPSLTESGGSTRPSLPRTDDEEMVLVQETEWDANKGSELVPSQGWTQDQYGICFDTATVTATKNLAYPLYPSNIQCLQGYSGIVPLSSPHELTVVRPLRHPEVLSEWQRDLVRFAITGQCEKLLKGIFNSPLCQTYDTICLDLGKGHTQRFPLFDVSLKGGESLLQLALEGVLMADNAGENLELLHEKIPEFPYPLYLLYRAKLASAACNKSECKWVWGKCQALLRKDEYNQSKYRSWITNALGLTVRHVEDNDEGWERKAGYHIDAYDERNVSTREDDLDVALLLLDQTKTIQSHSLAIAYKGTVGKFPADEKMKFNLEAKDIHDKAMREAGKLLHLLGMKSDPESPTNLMISLRHDGTLRILRIEQIKLLTINDPIKKESMIEQHVNHIEGENNRMGDILGNCYMMVDESLLQKMTKRFNDALINVREGKITFFTLDDVRISE